MAFVAVSKTDELSPGKMKPIEVSGKEILLANVAGKYCEVSDRCGYMNGRLSMGVLSGNTVTCPIHFSQFDVTMGKVVSEARRGSTSDRLKQLNLPPEFIDMAKHMSELQDVIKTCDLPVFSVQIQAQDVLVDI